MVKIIYYFRWKLNNCRAYVRVLHPESRAQTTKNNESSQIFHQAISTKQAYKSAKTKDVRKIQKLIEKQKVQRSLHVRKNIKYFPQKQIQEQHKK